MNDIISPGLRQQVALASDAPSTSRSKVTQRKGSLSGAGLSDFELMSTMMQKLRLLERKVCSQSVEIQSKEKKIALLQEKLRVLQKSKELPATSGRVVELEQTCHRLQSQVCEMERFLSDYGMVWVGNSSSGPQEEAEPKEEVQRGPHLRQPDVLEGRDFHMNFDLVVQSVRDLNVLAGEGVSHVQATPGGARLAHRSPIPLSLFSNGILMFDGPFRPYQDPSTQQCMLDLMDGYFPSELQERFPDGVPFQVNDRREEPFKVRHVGAEFPGVGKAVGGATECSLNSNGHTPGKAVHEERTPGKAVHEERTPGKAVHEERTPGKAVHEERTPGKAVHEERTPGKAVHEERTPGKAVHEERTPGKAVHEERTPGKAVHEERTPGKAVHEERTPGKAVHEERTPGKAVHEERTPGKAVHEERTPGKAVHEERTPGKAVHEERTPGKAVHEERTPGKAVHEERTPGKAVHEERTPGKAVHEERTPGKAVRKTHQAAGGKLSMEQFLNKLPKMVIKAGKVIDIRNSLKMGMQSPACTSTVIDTPALHNLRSPGDDIIELKVRAEDGRSCFILRMLLSETVGQLRQYLDAHRGPGTMTYHIISTFPLRRYDDISQTLHACGLMSNANLLLRPHPDP
ncbi:hypothetical protein SKAU_G00330830 [Synaphobranchus kaupii]|uniref:UBX domain-containing protein 11 n=1 Tax=Synaphobranchus kaupii TaxID=118154 RepID=A0A9Q1EL88_SYNKA|nr:hypothetical protein SKAU_G00330830 [Synaphobranchus kaupii]